MAVEGASGSTVRDIMEPDPARVYDTDTVERVLKVMRDHELPGVPVINEGGRCVGIITDEDLVLSEEESDLHLPHYFQLFGGVVFLEPLRHFEHRLRKAFAASAEDMMTPDPITIEPDATVEQAARTIAESKHNRLPVVEHGRLVGVVTRLDVLDALTARPTG
jgi:CBS domain-containing protein